MHGPSDARDADRAARDQREGELVASWLVDSTSLHSRERSTPHLKAAHAYLFHDLPHHAPGLVRDDTGSWSKFRALEGQDHSYEVRYLSRGVEARLTAVLAAFGGALSHAEHFKAQIRERALERLMRDRLTTEAASGAGHPEPAVPGPPKASSVSQVADPKDSAREHPWL